MSPRQRFPHEPSIRLFLLGRFALSDGQREVPLGEIPQRVVALLALQGLPMRREWVAAALWPEIDGSRAAARLRTYLYRLNRVSDRLVVRREGSLRLAEGVVVDHHRAAVLGRRLGDPGYQASIDELDPAPFAHGLLPGWYDEWLGPDREAFEQLRFGALEGIARRSLQLGLTERAIQAGLLVAHAEPFRESAHRLLAQAHVAAGNPIQALRQVDRYVDLLEREMNAEPSRLMIDLREGLRTALRS